MTWRDVLTTIQTAAADIQKAPPDDMLRLFHHQVVPSGAGNNAQCFTTWYFGGADIRYLGAYTYQIVKLAGDSSFTVDQLKTMFKEFVPQPSEFVAYCGVRTQWEYVQDIVRVLPEIDDRDDLLALLNAFLSYAASLNGWVYHYMKWEISGLYQHKMPEDIEEMSRLSKAS